LRSTGTRPIITLTTDFGLKDAYVASMKGVILSLAPEARIVDITHDIAPQGIVEGGFALSCAFPHFPCGTIHLMVVDPGVGTSRRLLLASTRRHYFLGPDNGALALAFEIEPPEEIIHLAPELCSSGNISATFHGRDILAPVAARLALGALPAQFGTPVDDFVRAPLPSPQLGSDKSLRLCVLAVDRFGNLILNLKEKQFKEAGGCAPGGGFELEIGGRIVSRLLGTYGESEGDEPLAVFNSSGYLEVAVRNGSAAARLGCAPGTLARLRL
jgi:S-adenosylmethionine hydrolase